MGVFDFLRRPWSLQAVARPWPADALAVHAHIVRHTRDGALDDQAMAAVGRRAEGDMRCYAGARDGIATHHMDVQPDPERVERLWQPLASVLREAAPAPLAALYEELCAGETLGVVDALHERTLAEQGLRAERMYALGHVLAREAPDVEAVKLGIAMIGWVASDDRELLLQLGLHDELTLFVAVALQNQLEGPEPLWFELAQRVHGWGRIHLVERLLDEPTPEVQAWLIREGFRNRIMDEYLALGCAVAGRLHEALREPDEPLLAAAPALFRALASGGPAPDLADYEHTEAALGAWLGHLERRPLRDDEREALAALSSRTELPAALAERVLARLA